MVCSGETDEPDELGYKFSILDDFTQMAQWLSLNLANSDHMVVSFSIDFLSNSKRNALFYRIAYEYSSAEWDGLRNYLRNVPWEDIFKFSVYSAS